MWFIKTHLGSQDVEIYIIYSFVKLCTMDSRYVKHIGQVVPWWVTNRAGQNWYLKIHREALYGEATLTLVYDKTNRRGTFGRCIEQERRSNVRRMTVAGPNWRPMRKSSPRARQSDPYRFL